MFIFYAIPALCLAILAGITVYEAYLARRRRPRLSKALTPDEIRARLIKAGFQPLPWPTKPYDQEEDR